MKAASGAAYLSAKTSLRAVVLSRTAADVSTSAITGESAHHPDESRQLDHKQRIGHIEEVCFPVALCVRTGGRYRGTVAAVGCWPGGHGTSTACLPSSSQSGMICSLRRRESRMGIWWCPGCRGEGAGR